MQVTLGEEGSPASGSIAVDEEERPTLLLRETNMGLAAERARVRPALLPRRRRARPGAGSFSGWAGLEESTGLCVAAAAGGITEERERREKGRVRKTERGKGVMSARVEIRRSREREYLFNVTLEIYWRK